ncbi:MAG: prolyl oligopeptidase family serine peptidase, partial [Anaerolineaceae bacterium]|nr:prolyl oligopeptidase family serine peptidase [Anaerolineaceae bacterium]
MLKNAYNWGRLLINLISTGPRSLMRLKYLPFIILLIALALGIISTGLVPGVQASDARPQDDPPDSRLEITPTPVDPLAPTPTPFLRPALPTAAPTAFSQVTASVQGPLTSAGDFPIYLPLIRDGGVTAFNRSGQTFITWTERTSLQGEVYALYRSSQEITADNFPQATRIVTVGKNSAAFYTNRFLDLSTKTWKARYSDRLIIDPSLGPVPDGMGLAVWTLSPDDFGGLSSGSGYYAVTVTPPGGKETFESGLTTGAVAEAIADPSPVKIDSSTIHIGAGGNVYIQYMNLRDWNPTFHAPNPSNNYYGLNPSDPNFSKAWQYAYDYAVFTPTPDLCGGRLPSQLPILLHLHGWKDNTSNKEDGYPDKYCAYGIYPIDVKDTWWFGFAQNKDYRTGGEPAAGDAVVNYTEQRLLRMVYDLMRNPPGPAVDANRVFVSGQSMGGTGSLALAERYPNVFAAAYASQPVTNFQTANIDKLDWVADAALKWGRPDLALPVRLDAPAGWADPLKKYDGVSAWDWQNLLLSLDPPAGGPMRERMQDDMAPFTVVHEPLDRVINWATQGQPAYTALNQSNQAYSGMVSSGGCVGGNEPNFPCHRWMYYVGLLPSVFPVGGANKFEWVP